MKSWYIGAIDQGWAAYWSSLIDTMQQIGVENLTPWEGQQLVAGNAYWWWAFQGFAVISDRPTVLKRDEEFRLHAEDGPAIAFADGWAIHAWHGTRVPADLIEEGWTAQQALKEPNSEVRRAAFERIGWDKAVAQLDLTPISTCPDPGNSPHELALYSLPEQIYEEPVKLLLMVNGSPDRSGELRRYGETVPDSISTALEAAAWQYDVKPEVYAQLARRT